MPGVIPLEDAADSYAERLKQHAQSVWDTIASAPQQVAQAAQPAFQAASAASQNIQPIVPSIPQGPDPSAVQAAQQSLLQHAQDAWNSVQQAPQQAVQALQPSAQAIDPTAASDATQRLLQHASDTWQSIQGSQPTDQSVQQWQPEPLPTGQAGVPGVDPRLSGPAQPPTRVTSASGESTIVNPPPAPDRSMSYQDYARAAAQRAGIDPNVFVAQIQQESGFNPTAKSGAGALGIAQFMPATAQGMNVDPTDPYAALDAAAKLDAQNLAKYQGDYQKTLAAYNAGGGAVDQYGGVPPYKETQSYVQTIMDNAKNVVGAVRDRVAPPHDASTPLQTDGTQIANTPNADGQIFPLAVKPSNAPTATYHSEGGSDLMAPRGTPVLNMQSGKVAEVFSDNGSHTVGGNAVLIHGNDGLDYYYAHFDQPTALKVGQTVNAGEQIGAVGNSGDAWKGGQGETHLHIGIGHGISDGVGSEGGLGQNFNAQNLLTSLEDGVGKATGGSAPTASTATAPPVSPHPLPGRPGGLVTPPAPPGWQPISTGTGLQEIDNAVQGAVSGPRAAIEQAVGAVGAAASDVGTRARGVAEQAAAAVEPTARNAADLVSQAPLPFGAGKVSDVTGLAQGAADLAGKVQTPDESNPLAARVAGTGLSALGTVARAVNDQLDQLNAASTASREAAGEDVYGQKYATAGGPQLEDEYRSLLAKRMAGDDSVSPRMTEIAGQLQQINDAIRAGRPQSEVNQALSAENPLTPVSSTLTNLGAMVLAAPLAAGEAPLVARALAEIIQPGTNPLALARAIRVVEDAKVPATDLVQAIDQVRKMPGTAELAPVRQQVTQSSTDLLQSMLDAAKAKGVAPEKLDALEQQISAMDPTAATRRALAPTRPTPAANAPSLEQFLQTAPRADDVVPARTVEQLASNLRNPQGRPGISIERGYMGVPGGPEVADTGTRYAVYRNPQGEPVGVLEMMLDRKTGQPDLLQVAVDPTYQRQGIATRLYQAAKDAGFDVEAASGQGGYTDEGARLAYAQQFGGGLAPPTGSESNALKAFLTGEAGSVPLTPAALRGGATVGGAVAGGVAGNATTPEDASPLERGLRTAGGAALGASAGAALASAASFRGTTDQRIMESLRSSGLVSGPARAAPAWRGIIPEAVEGTKQLLLTSPTTHIGNVIGNTIELGRQPVVLALGGRADDALAGMTSVIKALPQAASNALEALKGNQLATLSTEAANIPGRQPIYRALSAADAFTRTLGEYQGMSSEANRLLRDAGMTARDPAAASYLASHAADLFRAGARDGAQSVFAQAGATVGGATGAGRRVQNVFQTYARWKDGMLASPDPVHQAVGALLDFNLPFSGVPSRLLSIAVNRTPPGAQIGGVWRMGQALKAGDTAAFQRAAGETVLESSIEYLIGQNIANGNIRGPDDVEHPNGINLPGMGWVDTRELGAYALPMQIMAAWAEGWQKGGTNVSVGEDPRLPAFNAAFNAAMVPFTRAIPGVNMVQVLSLALQGNVTSAAAREAQDIISRLTVPGAARFIENAKDPLARDVEKKGVASLWEPTLAAWPGLADRLPVKIDPTTGQPMERVKSGLGTLVGAQQDVVSPLTVEADRLKKLGYDVTAPKTYPTSVTIAGSQVDLKPDEQRAVAQITGARLATLGARIDAPSYQNLPNTDAGNDKRQAMLKAIINVADLARTNAAQQVLGKDELRRRIAANRQIGGRLVEQAAAPDDFAFFNPTGENILTQRALAGSRA